MERPSIGKEYARFEGACFPDASAAQKTDMRRAFMAGAAVLIKVMEEIGSNDVSEDQGVIWLESIKNECEGPEL